MAWIGGLKQPVAFGFAQHGERLRLGHAGRAVWGEVIVEIRDGPEPSPNTHPICSPQGRFATSTMSLIEIAGARRFTTKASSTSGAFGDFNGVHKGDRTSPKSVQLKKTYTFQ